MRRRPLLRAAAVGGGAYCVGRRRQAIHRNGIADRPAGAGDRQARSADGVRPDGRG